jgi:hypothetical protein
VGSTLWAQAPAGMLGVLQRLELGLPPPLELPSRARRAAACST